MSLVLPCAALLTIQAGAVGTRIEATCGDSPNITYAHTPLPVKRVKPVYPRRAITRAVGGHVTLTYRITANGVPEEVKVLSSEPKNMFEQSAISAIRKWRFEPTPTFGKSTITYRTLTTSRCFIEDA